jgi:GxxExxY protein
MIFSCIFMYMRHLIYKPESYKIIVACMEVHNHLGKGFNEIVYKDALEYEFRKQNIPYQREQEFAVNYKDIILPHKFYADFVVWDKIILEIKNVLQLNNEYLEQTMNYFTVSNTKLGIIVNFRERELVYKRIVR